MGNGASGNGRLFGEASLLTKIIVGVMTAVIVSGLVFGVRVYAFMNAGARFTPTNYLENERAQDTEIHLLYVPRDVYRADMRRIEEHLVRIEKKLDEVLDE